MTPELANLTEVLASSKWGGDGPFARACEALICKQIQVPHAYLMPSCTAGLELACLLANVQPGDEVIMPSFGFSSAANAVVLRNATPVFVDIRLDTLNIDERLIEPAVTRRTKAIVVVHYAGVCCEMAVIRQVAQQANLTVIEDAAQAYLSTYRGMFAGRLGDIASFSTHETKNLRTGEGGFLTTRWAAVAERAEILREKGTNRSQFLRGEVDKYTWVDVGSSYLPSEFQAAVLLAQLDNAYEITARRHFRWQQYEDALASLEQRERLSRPTVPEECLHNAHIYRVALPSPEIRDATLRALKAAGVPASFHFVPLHSSPAGRRFGRTDGPLPVTDCAAACLLRLPLAWNTTESDVARAVDELTRALT